MSTYHRTDFKSSGHTHTHTHKLNYAAFLSLLFFRFIPFSGGPRKCVGDQFALLEAIVALAVVLQKMDIELVPDQKINMTTGATIHTTNVSVPLSMLMTASRWH